MCCLESWEVSGLAHVSTGVHPALSLAADKPKQQHIVLHNTCRLEWPAMSAQA